MAELTIYPIPCEIGDAVTLLKEGKRLARKDWIKNGTPETYLKIIDVGIGSKTISHILFAIDAKTNVQTAHQLTNDDLYAKWYLVKEEE